MSTHYPPSLPTTQTEYFNPYVLYDASAMQKTNTLWHRIWQVAAIATAIAFTALMTFAIVYTTIHFPMQLPIVSIVVFVGALPSSFRAFEYLWDKKLSYQKEAKIDAKLIRYSEQAKADPSLLKQTNANIDKFLTDEQKNTLYARYQYFTKKSEKKLNKLKRYESSKFSLKVIDFSNPEQIAFVKQHTRFELIKNAIQQSAALDKVKAAYFLHLLERSSDRRSISEFFTHVNLPETYRYIAKLNQDPSADLFIRTEKNDYTAADILNKSIRTLTNQIFQNKFYWFGN